jgi:hypothetical protein
MVVITAPAQKAPEPTQQFTITGKVKQELVISYNTLLNYKSHELHNVNTSCSPKKEERIKSAKGVLLKEVLDSAAFDYEKGAHLNEFYFVFVASDGYKLVYSYNEIFNTETGRNLYVVTALDGQPAGQLPNAMLILTTSDIKGGRRNMKWLKEVRVCRAE